MGKNANFRIRLESKFLDNLKVQAKEKGINVSELCRQRLADSSQLNRIEFMINKILKNERHRDK